MAAAITFILLYGTSLRVLWGKTNNKQKFYLAIIISAIICVIWTAARIVSGL